MAARSTGGTFRARPRAFLLLLALAAGAVAARADDRAPCPQVAFTGAERVKLTDVEKKLVCGDPGTEGWGRIPTNQAEYFLRAFLQRRGYHQPRFAARAGRLEVDPGRKTDVGRLAVEGAPAGVDPGKLRKLGGGTLTPDSLDKVKAALVSALQNAGYACPDVDVAANGKTGDISARVRDGGRRPFGAVAPSGLGGVDERIFRRYEAFRPGRPFDSRLLKLSADRTVADALFVSAYYDVNCSTAGELSIRRRVVEGKPQLYRIGAGFDTEGYLIGRAQWQNARIDARGSSIQGLLYASFRRETASLSMREFLSPATRFFLFPSATFERLNEIQFETANAEVALLPSYTWEMIDVRGEASAGPALERVRTLRGPGPTNDTFLLLRTKTSLVSHLWEYWSNEPREGWRADFQTDSRVAGAESSLTAHRFSLTGQGLWNVGQYDPPLAVLGTRGWAGTTYVTDRAAAQRDLQPQMRFFLGGDADVRGVQREALPGDANGFLTVLYDGLELRMGDVLPYGLQPFTFLDAAMGGRLDLHVDPDVYWSPGLGLRWRLPFGAIRGTVARGLVWHRDRTAPPLYPPHWQLFLSFGKEF